MGWPRIIWAKIIFCNWYLATYMAICMANIIKIYIDLNRYIFNLYYIYIYMQTIMQKFPHMRMHGYRFWKKQKSQRVTNKSQNLQIIYKNVSQFNGPDISRKHMIFNLYLYIHMHAHVQTKFSAWTGRGKRTSVLQRNPKIRLFTRTQVNSTAPIATLAENRRRRQWRHFSHDRRRQIIVDPLPIKFGSSFRPVP